METNLLEFKFKGDRNYIHGTDMFQKAVLFLSEKFEDKIENVEFKIHKMTNHQLVVYLYSLNNIIVLDKEKIAKLNFSINNENWEMVFVNSTETPFSRYEYDEDKIKNLSQINLNEQSISLISLSPFSAIETFVALTKILHLTLFADTKCKWLFCRWDSKNWNFTSKISNVKIKLIQRFGLYLTKSEVFLDDKPYGYIYFSARVNK